MKLAEVIHACGHKNILATHNSTFEITKDSHLTREGDCVIALTADKSFEDLQDKFKKALRNSNTRLIVIIEANNEREIINAWGNPKLRLSHPTDMVIRKSNYICDRTLGIKADKAAKDFSKQFVKKLQNNKQEIYITLTVKNTT